MVALRPNRWLAMSSDVSYPPSAPRDADCLSHPQAPMLQPVEAWLKLSRYTLSHWPFRAASTPSFRVPPLQGELNVHVTCSPKHAASRSPDQLVLLILGNIPYRPVVPLTHLGKRLGNVVPSACLQNRMYGALGSECRHLGESRSLVGLRA